MPRDRSQEAKVLIRQAVEILRRCEKPVHYTELAHLINAGSSGEISEKVAATKLYQVLSSFIKSCADQCPISLGGRGCFSLKPSGACASLEALLSSPVAKARPSPDAPKQHKYTNPALHRISAAERSAPIERLHFSVRTLNVMEREGVGDIGGFVDRIQNGFGKLRGFGASCQEEAFSAARALVAAVEETGSIDWCLFGSTLGFRILPENPAPEAVLLEKLPQLCRDAVAAQFERETLVIFEKRWLVPPDKRCTLDELGAVFHLSKERIRQKESMALDALRNALLRGYYSGMCFRFRPELETILRGFRRHFDETGITAWNESAFGAELRALSSGTEVPNIELMAAILGFVTRKAIWTDEEGIAFDEEKHTTEAMDRTFEIVLNIRKVLGEDCLGLDSVRLAAAVNKRSPHLRMHIDELPEHARLCSKVEFYGEDTYRLKFEALPNMADRAVRVLAENGKPMQREEILRHINRHALRRLNQMATLVGQMSVDPRLEPIGKTGEWALTEWGHETGSLHAIVEAILAREGKELQVEDIIDRVLEVRPQANITSIRMTLQLRPLQFRRVSPGVYGLASWYGTSAPRPRSPVKRKKPKQSERIVARAIEILAKHGEAGMPMSVLVKLLADEFGVIANTVYGAIGQSGEIHSRPYPDRPGNHCYLKH